MNIVYEIKDNFLKILICFAGCIHNLERWSSVYLANKNNLHIEQKFTSVINIDVYKPDKNDWY